MPTKKVKSTGRYGSRYGLRIRKSVLAIDILKRTKWECPDCLKKTLRREAAGIWKCRKCSLKLAGKAYRPY